MAKGTSDTHTSQIIHTDTDQIHYAGATNTHTHTHTYIHTHLSLIHI